MPGVTIDGRSVEVPAGATLLDAARAIGIDIPSLCYREGLHPMTSCMLCLMRDRSTGRLVPSCATPAEEGMCIESESAEIRSLRRTGLELLLSDHAGDCSAPCEHACPTGLDVPEMLQHVAEGGWAQAIATIRRDVALPSVLGRVCDGRCEKACRRGRIDSSAAICLVQRFVADADLQAASPTLPPRQSSTGKRVAVIGSGPAGLSAAYHLLIAGHACTIFEREERAGGMLRNAYAVEQLPPEILDAEIALVGRLGGEFKLGTPVSTESNLSELGQAYDAVLVTSRSWAGTLGEEIRRQPGLFFACGTESSDQAVVHAVAEGRTAARRLDGFVRGEVDPAAPPVFASRLGKLNEIELTQLMTGASSGGRIQPSLGLRAGFTEAEARAEAQRCLHCDCAASDGCRLRHYAQMYGAKPAEFRGQRRNVSRRMQAGGVVYEPGKCIVCGLCVQVAQAAGERLGFAFIGRGFDVRVDVPFGRSLSEGLEQAGRACVEACPSGALSLGSHGGCAACGTSGCAGTEQSCE